MDLDDESTQDDNWTVVTRKNKRNATYCVHIRKMYTRLPNCVAHLNPLVENKTPVQHLSQFRLRAGQCRNRAWKRQLSALYKTDTHRVNFRQAIENLKINLPTVRFQCTPKIATFHANNEATMMTYDSGADGHYFIKDDRKKEGLPIIQRSTKHVGVANDGTSTGTYVTKIPSSTFPTKLPRQIPSMICRPLC